MKTVIIKSTIIAMLFVVSIMSLHPLYGQETTNNINNQIQTTAEQIKNMADEVANNSTGKINQTEAKNILIQLGEAAKKTALGGADILSNISGEIKEGLRN
jgi:polyhydroxyalkanoate synthesis regulator phasin